MPVSGLTGARERSEAGQAPDPGFGVYVHWPFCAAKCPYCDFNSHVREDVDQTRWQRALVAELRHAARAAPTRAATSVFFGGGTPSLMEPETVSAVIEAVEEHVGLAADAEITLEANPTSVEAMRFQGYHKAGVNRLSLGIQSLNGSSLRFLGRQHSAGEALAALECAQAVFERYSFDMIYALPGQSAEDWRDELSRALTFAGEHLSLYQLTIEPNTGFGAAWRRGALDMPDDDLAADLYEVTRELAVAAGLPAYEISNHARPGAESRHNLVYWRSGDFLGIGPGAYQRIHGADATLELARMRKPEAWLDSVERSGHGTAEERRIEAVSERAADALMMGLRLAEGLWFTNFERAAGVAFPDFVDARQLARLADEGLIEADDGRIRATDRGLPVLNALTSSLLA